MTREEIIAKLTDLLGAEQAESAADALIGAEAPPEAEESAPEPEESAAEAEPEAPDAEPEATEPEATEPQTPEAELEPSEPEPEPPAPEPEPSEPEAPVPEPSEPDPAEALHAENGELRDRLKGMMMRLAAMSLGVAPERVDVVRRLAVFGDGELTEETALAAVRRVLEEVPELAGRAVPVTGSIGTHPREAPRTVDPFEKGFFR